MSRHLKRDAEAGLVDKLRQTCADHLSLVADDNGSIAMFRDEFNAAL